MYKNEIIIMLKIYLETKCAPYGGILNSNVNKCCAASCGTCGGSGCSRRPGGRRKCCVRRIPSKRVCGPDQNAPCSLNEGKCKKMHFH